MAKKLKEIEEPRDRLGFTPSDYEAMQTAAEKDGKLNDSLLNGWDVTPEQITLINSPSHPLHRVAVITFYDVNLKRLYRMAIGFLKHDNREYLTDIVSYEDLLHQLFCDMLGGWLKLPHNTEKIDTAIYRCFTYAAVGGLEGVEDVKAKRTLCTA